MALDPSVAAAIMGPALDQPLRIVWEDGKHTDDVRVLATDANCLAGPIIVLANNWQIYFFQKDGVCMDHPCSLITRPEEREVWVFAFGERDNLEYRVFEQEETARAHAEAVQRSVLETRTSTDEAHDPFISVSRTMLINGKVLE